MKIGIKYCGGCNTKFDRRNVVEQIRRDNPQLHFDFVKESEEYDFVVVLQGCHVLCADVSRLRSKHGFLDLDDSNYERAQSVLEEFIAGIS